MKQQNIGLCQRTCNATLFFKELFFTISFSFLFLLLLQLVKTKEFSPDPEIPNHKTQYLDPLTSQFITYLQKFTLLLNNVLHRDSTIHHFDFFQESEMNNYIVKVVL